MKIAIFSIGLDETFYLVVNQAELELLEGLERKGIFREDVALESCSLETFVKLHKT